MCSRKIAATRQADLELACQRWEGMDGALGMVSLTAAHHAGQTLAQVWDAVADGWHSITSGRAWAKVRQRFGIEGWTRVIETTVGENGWHVHAHVVLFLRDGGVAVGNGLNAELRAELTGYLYKRWNHGLGKTGFRASRAHGVDVKLMHGRNAASVLADYFAKGQYTPDGSAPAAVALEAARGDLKETRGGTRTPFRVLLDFIRYGDVADLELWQEWEQASHNRRQSAWMRGFREFLRLTRDKTDEEIAAEELGSDVDDVVILPKETVVATAGARYVLLDLLEEGGRSALVSWLDGYGLPWLDPVQHLRRET